MKRLIRALIPARVWDGLTRIYASGQLWDWRHRVSTSGVLATPAPDGVQYEPCHPSLPRFVFSRLKIDYPRYTFVDYGSGLGRVVLVAAGFPFKKAMGVEYSAEFCSRSRENNLRYRGPRRSGTIEVVNADAGSWELPAGPLVLFFNNPFRRAVMAQTVRQIQAAMERENRDIYICCIFQWTLREMFQNLPQIQMVEDGMRNGSSYTIYRVPALTSHSGAA